MSSEMSSPKKTNHYLAIFKQKNMAALFLMGFASGLPLALTSGTLHAWMAVEHISIKTIGFFTLVTQAYVFKFLWAPLMDRYVPPFLGRRRGWLVLIQFLLAISIFIMGSLEPTKNLQWMAVVGVLIAFFSASQDIVIDAYRTDLLPVKEQAAGSAVSTFGYRIAMLVSSGLAIWLASRYLGWQSTYQLMAILMFLSIIVSFWANEPEQPARPPKTLEQAVVEPFFDFFSRNNAWLFLALIVFYKISDVIAVSLSTPFLISSVGLSAEEVAEIHKTLGLITTILGVMLAGVVMQRVALTKALFVFCCLQALSNIGYWLLSVTAKNLIVTSIVISFDNICGGMGSAAFVALLATLCNKSFSATQFALLSSLSAIGRIYIGPIAGIFVENYGWSKLFLFSVIAVLPTLLLLFLCRHELSRIIETNQFSKRTSFSEGYKLILYLLAVAGGLGLIWIILWIPAQAQLLPKLILVDYLGMTCVFLLSLGILIGIMLDYIVLRAQKRA